MEIKRKGGARRGERKKGRSREATRAVVLGAIHVEKKTHLPVVESASADLFREALVALLLQGVRSGHAGCCLVAVWFLSACESM